MTSFAYVVRDSLGAQHEGEVEASTKEDALQNLSTDGSHVIRIEEVDCSGSLLPRRVSKNEIVYLTSQLSIMVDTGISLAAALEGIAAQCENPTLKKMLVDIKSRVEGGEDLSKALQQYPKCFDMTFIALIKSSEQTGQLAEMLDSVSGYLRAEVETRAKIVGALAYPGIMAVVALGITIFLLTFIMPKFTPLFEKKQIDLPLTTTMLMAISDAMINYWYWWLLATVTVVATGGVWLRSRSGQLVKDYVLLNIPIVGTMNRKVIISRSIRTLGAMIGNGVALLDAIQLTAEVSGNVYFKRVWLAVQDSVTQGARICDELYGSPLFPNTLVQMISSGEESGKLDYVLKKVSGYYDKEVDSSLKTVTSMIEPLVIVVMGGVVATIGFSIMLPIFQLSRPH